MLARETGDGRELILSDLSFQRGEGETVAARLRDLRARGWRVTWRDHHHEQWQEGDVAALRDAGAHVTLDASGTRCGTDLVQADLLPDDPFAGRLAEVVRDHDLWLQQDPWGKVLADAAYALGSRGFVAHLLEHRQVDHPRYRELAEAQREAKAQAVRWGLERARLHEGDAARVAVVYGKLPTNDLLHELAERRGVHLGVLVKPRGTFSLRSVDEVPVCHEVAQRWSGGGHPNASGGLLGVPWWGLPLLWLRRERHPRARALAQDAVREVDGHLEAGP